MCSVIEQHTQCENVYEKAKMISLRILSRGSEVLCECWRALARGERDMIAAVNTENYLQASK